MTMRSYPVILLACVLSGPAAWGLEAPFIDSRAIKASFDSITAADMEILRGQKILFASRSFGLNLNKGLTALAKQDAKYQLLGAYQRFDVFKAGGDIGIIPADAFAKNTFVHFLATYHPHTRRVEEMDRLLRQDPHRFGASVNVVMIYFHTATPAAFATYADTMDSWRQDFPKTCFIYATAGFMADSRAKENAEAHAFSELIRERYRGKAPVYDFGAILSDDFRVGHAYCPEYSQDPAGVHPNLPAGEAMMAKGFLLALRDGLRWHAAGGKAGTAAAGKPAKAMEVEVLPDDHPEMLAVRAILDANGLADKKAASVAVVTKGHVTSLFLQEGGITTIPDAIGTLTRLRTLHVYGDRNLPHPLLSSMSPAIGACTAIEDLLLNSNELTTLPVEITKLTRLKSLSLADNRLRDLDPKVLAWAKRFDAKGLAAQAE